MLKGAMCSRRVRSTVIAVYLVEYARPGHDVKLHPHFHCHWLLFVLICHEDGQSAFLHKVVFIYES